MTNKKTVVFGASPKPSRYSNRAVVRLNANGHEVVPVGFRNGEIAGIAIQKDNPQVEDVHTVTLYLNPQRQVAFYDYILGLNPKRIIFNPGTENAELIQMAEAKGIEAEVACTLVMLSVGNY